MEFGSSVLEELSIAGDTAHISDQCFNILVAHACQGLLAASNRDDIANDTSFKDTDKGSLKSAYSGLVTLITEATKWDAEPSSIGAVLEECKFTIDRINSFNNIYLAKKPLIQILLGSIGKSPPHIVDVDWRLDYYIKNNHVDKVNQPVYLITLKTEIPGNSELQEIQFSCSMEQLQDLVGKLKVSTKCLEKIGQM
ncbi:COMM domain-containing protein 3 [Patella vulgata]|uniref:COMM domain-containing protein 3 n=1 Tax=Patella vulgata TaxID=6465 RepID=UPI0021801696|nr:COMM domain-containing protein 3 [Patella vulgata]